MTRRSLACVVILCAVGAALAAQTPDRARTEAQGRLATDRIRALQNEADRLAAEARTLLGDLRALEVEQQLQVERAKAAQAAVASGQTAILEAMTRLDSLEQARVGQLPDLKAQLVDIYKRGRTGYAELLFGGSSVRDFGRATRAFAALMRIQERRVTEHRRTLDELHQQRFLLEEELLGLQTREEEALQARAAADRALAARTALIARTDTRRDLNAQLAGELQVAYERLQQQVANLAAGRPVDPVVLPITPFRGALDWPVPGRIAVSFGQPSGRLGDTTARNGVEIAAAEGTRAYAVYPGTVSYADAFTGFGNLVIIDHGGNTYSLYGYLTSLTVARGAAVDRGAELGRVGVAPAGPSALYFELRIDGRSIDPVQWLRPR